MGYASTGFWGGLTLGRAVLSGIVNKLGERRMVFVLTVSALVMQLLFWFVPNIIADAIFMSVLGFCIAQFFPVAISVMTKLLPREQHVAAIGIPLTCMLPYNNPLMTLSRLRGNCRPSWLRGISIHDGSNRFLERSSSLATNHGRLTCGDVCILGSAPKD